LARDDVIQHHGDIAAQRLLDFDRMFGSQFDQAAIDVRPEYGSLAR
jgi:hypothetical protein